MRGALAIGLFCVFATAVWAQNQPATPPATAIYRMGREEFLVLAGTDDSLRAIVNLFFRKRKTASTLLSVASASLGVFVVASSYAILRAAGQPRPGGPDPADELQVFAAVTGAVFSTTAIAGSAHLVRYPRKRLNQIIADRKDGKPISARYARRLRPGDFE